jgi:predicted nucleic acid-binding protein
VKGYLVDTNIPSELTREAPDARVAAFLRNAGKESIFLSVMTIGEICKGIDLLPVSQKRSWLQNWLDIDVRSWFAGRILLSPNPSLNAGAIWPRPPDNEGSRRRLWTA